MTQPLPDTVEALQSMVRQLTAERDEADRRAGAAERQLVSLREDANRHQQWLDNAKRAAGHSVNTSFDIVWADALAALKDSRYLHPVAIVAQLVKDVPEVHWTARELVGKGHVLYVKHEGR